MRILDCEIIDKTSNEFLEEHTMTLLVQQRPSDTDSHASVIEEVHLADSFYQDVHRLDSGKVELREKGSAIFIDVPKTSANGRSITLKPASYSFDRSRASIDYGQLIFRGIPVATPGWEESIPTNGIDLAYFHKHLKTK